MRCSKRRNKWEERCKRCIQYSLQCSVSPPITTPARRFAKQNLPHTTPSTKPGYLSPGSEATTPERFHLNKITKILISWDQGTAQTKVNYRVFRDSENQNPRALRDMMIGLKAEDVTWGDGDPFCPTQLAFPKGAQDCSKLLWGTGVDQALTSGQISHEDVFKYLKPQLYDDAKASAFHCNDLLDKIRELDLRWLPPDGSSPSETQIHIGNDQHECVDLLSDSHAEDPNQAHEKRTLEMLWRHYQENAFIYVLNKIWKRHQANLPWLPPRDSCHEYQSLEEINFQDCLVETLIAVPASASVQQIDFALRTARQAGISNCFAVSEPCSAAALVLQASYEKGETMSDSLAFLFVDIGSGTCDVTTFKIEVRPAQDTENVISGRKVMSLKEIVKGQTAWVGVGTINQAFLRHLEATFDIDEIVREMNRPGMKSRTTWTRIRFLDEAEAAFEIAKKRFSLDHVSGNKRTFVKLPALQQLSYYISKDGGMDIDNGHISLGPKAMEKIFAPCVAGIISLIRGQLEQLSLHNNAQEVPVRSRCCVKQVFLVGGGAENRYLTDQIRAAVSQLKMGYNVTVVQPQSYIDSLLMTCRGGIVLAADKEFIGERILRRAFGFCQDDRARGSRYDLGRTYNDPVTGIRFKKDIVRFLVRIGDTIKGRQSFGPMIGERDLYTYCEERNRDGWEITEVLWYTDNPKIMDHTDLWVDEKKHKIHAAGTVTFRLKFADVMDIQLQQDLHGNEYRCVEYRSWFELEGYSLEFFIEISRTGTFRSCGNDDIVRVRGEINCQSSYQLYMPANAP